MGTTMIKNLGKLLCLNLLKIAIINDLKKEHQTMLDQRF